MGTERYSLYDDNVLVLPSSVLRGIISDTVKRSQQQQRVGGDQNMDRVLRDDWMTRLG